MPVGSDGGGNLNTRNGDANNHIAAHHQLTNHRIDWDTAQCLTYSNLEQTPR